jgi:TetR/AcrR family transcriptional regulator, cholesterol catabolism regulator
MVSPGNQRSVLRDRILDRAELQLWELGHRGMRVDELARDVGISKRTLYEEFPSKQDMAREALVRRLDRLRTSIDEILARERDEVVQLRELAKQIAAVYASARPPFWRDVSSTKALRELVEASRAHADAKLEGVIRSGVKRKRFRRDVDPRLVRRALLGAVESIVRPEQLSAEGLSVDQAYVAIVDLIVNGLAV